jgi:ankyrin repeat protein
MCAAGANQVEAARVLLARGMKREGVVKGLLYAAARGSLDVINLILNSGVPVDSTTEDGVTGLMFASSYNQLDAARLLLDKGAKVDWKDRADETALGLAKSREMRQLLLDRGASNR